MPILVILAHNIKKQIAVNDHSLCSSYYNNVATLPCEMPKL